MDDLSALTDDPIAHARQMDSPRYKRAAYVVLRPWLNRMTRRHLSGETLALPRLSMVLPERGLPLTTRRAWLARYARLRSGRLLVQGTGSGWDTLSWRAWCPSVIGVELYPFLQAWTRVQRYGPRFAQGALDALPFSDAAFTAAASDAVLEHCRDLEAVLAETVRVVRPGGYVYAAYGPLWYCFGGDHFSGAGGLEYGYAHLDADRARYRSYVRAHADPTADAQGGLRYIALDLFSRLTTTQYLAAFAKAGLALVDLRLEVSAAAVTFLRRWPSRARALATHHRVGLDDLLIKTNLVILRRPASHHGSNSTTR